MSGRRWSSTQTTLEEAVRLGGGAAAQTTLAQARSMDCGDLCCLRTFKGHRGLVTSVCLSADGRYALSGSVDQTLHLWELAWEYAVREPADRDEGARAYLEMFLNAYTPYAGSPPTDRKPTEEEITLALTRRGKPVWNEDDFRKLLDTLGYAGHGWLRPEGVMAKLKEMAAEWEGPPPLGGTDR